MLCYVLYRLVSPMPEATSNVQDRYYSSATPIASSIAIDTTTPMHSPPPARANAFCYQMTKNILKKKFMVPFLRSTQMLTMMECPLMDLCVQAKAWGQTVKSWRRSQLPRAQRDRASVPCFLPPMNACKQCYDRARPLLHLELAGARLWATTKRSTSISAPQTHATNSMCARYARAFAAVLHALISSSRTFVELHSGLSRR
jgi:hypothetical protein